MEDPRNRRFVIGPSHLTLGGATLCFAILLAMTGWTWPLGGVAVLLPVAAYFALC